MKRRALLMLAMTVLLIHVGPVAAGSEMTWWKNKTLSREGQVNGHERCEMAASVTVKEFGKSGITRLKAKFMLKGSNFKYLPSYQEFGYYYSRSFPDDGLNYWAEFHNRQWFAQFVGDRFAMLVKMVGERPSFWQPDVVRWGYLGDVGCDGLTPVGPKS